MRANDTSSPDPAETLTVSTVTQGNKGGSVSIHGPGTVSYTPVAGFTGVETFTYALPASASRVTARLRLQAIGLEVLDDFQGLTLPIAERVLRNGYVQGNTLRSRVRTLTVPGTQRELRREGDGWTDASPPVPPSACVED